MQFEQPTYQTPFAAYPPGYTYSSPAPGMPQRNGFYDGVGSIPTPGPTPSPRTPNSSSRRRSTTHDFSGSAEYVSGKRPTSSRRSADHPEFYGSTSSPRPSAAHRATYMHTPLHTPPPSAHANMPNIYSYAVPGFTPQADYFPFSPGPQSPPPHEGRHSRSHHRRGDSYGGEPSPRSPQKPSKPPRTTSASGMDPETLRRKAAEAGIPTDYSLKNWDPNERPVILLGSVFDANSLGEWVFNWTKYHHGRTHDATKTAGGLWELLIELNSKLKRARDLFDAIKKPDNKEIVEEFMDSGERLWQRLKSLLRSCEDYMWMGAKRVTSPKHHDGKTKVQMGKQSGAEFVDAMFNGEKEWEKTERLMRGMATWCQRFQVNCEEILRSPDA